MSEEFPKKIVRPIVLCHQAINSLMGGVDFVERERGRKREAFSLAAFFLYFSIPTFPVYSTPPSTKA